MTRPGPVRLGTLLAIIVLADAAGCFPSASAAQAASSRISTQDTVGQLERDPDRTVRGLVTVRPGRSEQVATAAKDAGPNAVNPLSGTQSIAIQGNAAQVRAAARTGQVLQIQVEDTVQGR